MDLESRMKTSIPGHCSESNKSPIAVIPNTVSVMHTVFDWCDFSSCDPKVDRIKSK